MSITVTEAKFIDLKSTLRSLFESDKSDLDFGVCRIMAAEYEDTE